MQKTHREHGSERSIIVVDDDLLALKRIRRILEQAGHRVSTFKNPCRALKHLEEEYYDVIISDVKMPEMDGLSLLSQTKALHPGMEVILITGYASFDQAVEATKMGAFHYLAKPFTPEQLRKAVDKALKIKGIKNGGPLQRGTGGTEQTRPVIVGKSHKMRHVDSVIRQIAPTDCNVLITGESGTGKELVARTIHALSHRAKGPFVAFNCGAFSEELVTNELFGHEKEAFTGAISLKHGLLETANGGTLFLDEIGDMPFSMQIKLLRVIQEREFIRVGGTRPIHLDVRFIAATATDLKGAVSAGTFRQDLYFRLNVVNISLPSLIERKGDIPLLAYHILEKVKRRMSKSITAISADAMTVLENYAFPGNVRELENVIERAVAICQGPVIQVHHLPPDLAELQFRSYHRPSGSLLKLEDLEQDYIRHILKITGGVRTKAAEILGIDRASLWRKMKKYGID